MAAWLLIAAVAVTLISWRVIGVAGAIWQGQAHTNARCVLMNEAALSGTMLYEQFPDGTILLVAPSPAGPDQAALAGTASASDEIRTG